MCSTDKAMHFMYLISYELSSIVLCWHFLSLVSVIFFLSIWDHVPLGSRILHTQIWVWNSRATVAGILVYLGIKYSKYLHSYIVLCIRCFILVSVVRVIYIHLLQVCFHFFILHPFLHTPFIIIALQYYNYILCWFRDYTNPYLPVAPSAIDGSGQVMFWELTISLIL